MNVAATRSAEQIVRDAYDIVEKTGDIDAFLQDFSEDAELAESAWLPYGGVHRGKAQIRETITQIMTHHWRDFSIVIDRYMADDEFVLVDLTLTAVGNKTGKQAKFPIVEMWRVVGGKVVWLRPVYGDYDQVRDALALS